MSAKKLSLTLALGVCFGILPFMGVTTYLLIVLALILRLNIPAIQLVNYAVYLIQILLFVPFLKTGQFIFNGPELPFDLSNVIAMFKKDFWLTFMAIWKINLMGILVWLLISIPLGFIIYKASLQFFTKKQEKLQLEIA